MRVPILLHGREHSGLATEALKKQIKSEICTVAHREILYIEWSYTTICTCFCCCFVQRFVRDATGFWLCCWFDTRLYFWLCCCTCLFRLRSDCGFRCRPLCRFCWHFYSRFWFDSCTGSCWGSRSDWFGLGCRFWSQFRSWSGWYRFRLFWGSFWCGLSFRLRSCWWSCGFGRWSADSWPV